MARLFCVTFAVFLLMFHQSKGNSTTSCEQKYRSLSYLDVASDMIWKAKQFYPVCPFIGKNVTSRAVDCEELFRMGYNKSGSYSIFPRNRMLDDKSLDVYCDMITDGGGWTLIQRRGNFLRPKDYFFQDWANYKAGFGDIEKDFWLGNDNIYALSNQRKYSVRFDLKDVGGTSKYALYDDFWIENEAQGYTLHIKDFSGNAGDSMKTHDGMKFSTKDIDNDHRNEQHCAQLYKGGWWYNACHEANLNGLYLRGKHDSFADGVNWKSWKEYHESLDTTEIKIRPKNFRKQLQQKQENKKTPAVEFVESPKP